eukprot:scaffold118695_cov18-Tisochrysis_lutea.AAC.1
MHLPVITSCNGDVQAVWRHFQQQHTNSSLARQVQLTKELANLKLRSGERMVQYMARARALKHSLKSAGQSISTQALIVYILAGLPDEYKSIVDVVSVKGSSSLEELEPILMTAEQQN